MAAAAGEAARGGAGGGGGSPGHAASPLPACLARTGNSGGRTHAGGSSVLSRSEAMHLSLGRCRRGSGLQTRAGSSPRSPAQLRARRCLPQWASALGTQHPRRGRLVGGALAGSDLREGARRSQSPAHCSCGHAHISPRPRPPASCHTPSCRLASPRPSAHLGRELSPLLPSGAPPRRLPRLSRAGSPKTRSKGVRLRCPATALSMLSSRGRFFGRK